MDKELVYYLSGVILLTLFTLISLCLYSRRRNNIHNHKKDLYYNDFHLFYPSQGVSDETEKLELNVSNDIKDIIDFKLEKNIIIIHSDTKI